MIGTEVEFELESLSPIMFNMYLDEPQPKTSEGFRDQGPRKCHKNESGNICITSEMILASVREAIGDIAPRGKGKSMRRDVMAGLFFKEQLYPIGKKEPDDIDARPVIRGKGEKTTLVICYRPMIKEWKIAGTMILIDLQPQLIKQALDRAGMKVGMGSYRPRFGRFIVTKWEVKKQE
jgi:hypothetical protein